MRKRLTKTGNSLALVLDRPVLKATGIGAATTVEVTRFFARDGSSCAAAHR
jgi:hypothetical protein